MADDVDDGVSSSHSQNVTQHEQVKSPGTENQYSTFDHWVLFHFFVFFSFSFIVGLVIIHSSLLWHRYQSSNDDVLSLLLNYNSPVPQNTVETLVNISRVAS